MADLAAIVDEDIRDVDLRESEKVDTYVYKGCGCQRGPSNTPCSKIFTRAYVEDERDHCHTLTNEQLDMVILGQLQMHRRSPVFVRQYQKGSHKKKKELSDTHVQHLTQQFRPTTKFYIRDIQVCETCFCFLKTLGRRRLHALQTHLDTNGLTPRIHGSTGVPPHNAHGPEAITNVVTFIKTLAEVRAMPLPGRLPNVKSVSKMMLPTDDTKRSIHTEYVEACKKEPVKQPVSLTTFKEIWLKYVPEITIMTPQTDLCQECQDNSVNVLRSSGLPDEEKEKRYTKAVNHLQKAETQRNSYNEQCQRAKEQASLGKTETLTLSFDYAQNLVYPHSSAQVGPAYFKTARRCGLFGILDEGNNIQTNYLIDECDAVGKGANSVISMLDHFLDQSPDQPKFLKLHADNCTGQNKNNSVVQFLAWRVMKGKHDDIELSFMRAGHTKFGPDRMFGHIKTKYYRSRVVDTLEDIEILVNTSSLNSQNKAVITYDYVHDIRNVVWRDWVSFLAPQFKKMSGILSFQHFQVNKNDPYTILSRRSATDPAEILDIRPTKQLHTDSMPQVIVRKEMDITRAWYLYEEVSSLCDSPLAASLTCPMPNEPKPKKRRTHEE